MGVRLSGWRDIGCAADRLWGVAVRGRDTGKELWRHYTIPEPAKPLRTNSAGTQLYGPAGAAVWNTPTLDRSKGVLYFGSGNDYIWPSTNASDAIFAVSTSGGALQWKRQLLDNDVAEGGCGSEREAHQANCPPGKFARGPNDDMAAAPALGALTDGRRVLIVMLQSNLVTALDPDRNGAVLWRRQGAARPNANNNGGFGPAVDKDKVYVPFHYADGTGGISALRLTDGAPVWSTTAPKPTDCPPASAGWCTSGQFAAASEIGGVVFGGARDGTLRAFSTRDGTILWSYQTRRAFTTINGVAATGGSIQAAGPTIAGGMVYISSGYGNGAPGNVLLAFGVN